MTGNEIRTELMKLLYQLKKNLFVIVYSIFKGGFMFSGKFTGFLLLLFALTIFGCNENPTIVKDKHWQTPPSIETPCGVQYYNLYIDQTTLAGNVRIANDLDSLYITYTLNGSYLAEPGEMHVWMGISAPSKRGTPKQYPFQSNNSDYVSTYTFSFALTDVQQYMDAGKFYFMTYVSVVTPTGKGRYSKASDGFSEVITNTKSKGAWFGYNSYQIQYCGAN
jgi:hypothetical protein